MYVCVCIYIYIYICIRNIFASSLCYNFNVEKQLRDIFASSVGTRELPGLLRMIKKMFPIVVLMYVCMSV